MANTYDISSINGAIFTVTKNSGKPERYFKRNIRKVFFEANASKLHIEFLGNADEKSIIVNLSELRVEGSGSAPVSEAAALTALDAVFLDEGSVSNTLGLEDVIEEDHETTLPASYIGVSRDVSTYIDLLNDFTFTLGEATIVLTGDRMSLFSDCTTNSVLRLFSIGSVLMAVGEFTGISINGGGDTELVVNITQLVIDPSQYASLHTINYSHFTNKTLPTFEEVNRQIKKANSYADIQYNDLLAGAMSGTLQDGGYNVFGSSTGSVLTVSVENGAIKRVASLRTGAKAEGIINIDSPAIGQVGTFNVRVNGVAVNSAPIGWSDADTDEIIAERLAMAIDTGGYIGVFEPSTTGATIQASTVGFSYNGTLTVETVSGDDLPTLGVDDVTGGYFYNMPFNYDLLNDAATPLLAEYPKISWFQIYPSATPSIARQSMASDISVASVQNVGTGLFNVFFTRPLKNPLLLPAYNGTASYSVNAGGLSDGVSSFTFVLRVNAGHTPDDGSEVVNFVLVEQAD